MFLGTLASVPLFMVVCGLFRKFRMGFVLGIAGLVAYLLARLGKHLVGRGRPGEVFADLQLRDVDATGLGFPSGHAAVSAAMVVAALPYLPPRWRPPVLLFPLFMAFARVYTGAHLPLDVVSGAAIGVVVGSSLHLLLGVPLVPAADPPVVAPAVEGTPGTGREDRDASTGRGSARTRASASLITSLSFLSPFTFAGASSRARNAPGRIARPSRRAEAVPRGPGFSTSR